jgi:carbohydrate kinase (thermoresistant glucokinase family)
MAMIAGACKNRRWRCILFKPAIISFTPKIMQANKSDNGSQRWVAMGVCGCGKSEIGRRLAYQLGVDFFEGDDDHSASNVAKMAKGIPLDDADRNEWLLGLQSRIAKAREDGRGLVMSCSALKRSYRDILRGGDPSLKFAHLDGDRILIESRMRARTGHFMQVALLDSQFNTLEPLLREETGIVLDIRKNQEELVNEIILRSKGMI